MAKRIATFRFTVAVLAGLLGACAQSPVRTPFELIDEQAQVYVGEVDHSIRRMDVRIGERIYSGFYIQPMESSVGTAFPPLFSHPMVMQQTRSVTTSNRAQAHLRSSDGEHLACEFLLEQTRVVGSCKTPAGRGFQLVGGN